MNEQIVKLFMQSVDSNYIPLPIEDHMPSWTEKFAELIAKECMQVCADRGAHHDGLYSAWADDCSKRIGQHFGVEE